MNEKAYILEPGTGSYCRAVIERCSKKARREALTKGFLLCTGTLGGLLFAEFFLDRYLDLPVLVRAILHVLCTLAFLKSFYHFLLLPLRRSADSNELARKVEQNYPFLDGLFLTAVQLSRPGNPAASYVSKALLQQVVKEADELSAEVEPKKLFPLKNLIPAAAAFGLSCVVWALTFLTASESLSVWKQRLLLRQIPYPRSVSLAFLQPQGREVKVARGEDLVVAVEVKRGTVRRVELVCQWGKARRVELMTGWGNKIFRHTVKNVIAPFSMYARGGDAETEVVKVHVVPRPRIESIEATVFFPEYTGMKPQKSEDGSVKALVGSEVSYVAFAVPRVRKAVFEFYKSGEKKPSMVQEIKPEDKEDKSKLTGRFTVSSSGYYSFVLESFEGFSNREQGLNRYRVRAIPDKIPRVRITKPVGTEECTAQGSVQIEGMVTDDWGVVEAKFSYRVKAPTDREPQAASKVNLPIEAGSKQVKISYVFDLSPLKLTEGTTIYCTVEAKDSAGGVGRSSESVIVIVRPEDLRDIVFDRLSAIREEVKEAAKLQGRARRRLLSFLEENRKKTALSPKDLSILGQIRSEQSSVARSVGRASRSLRDLRDRMQRNAVGDLQEQKWLDSLADELEALKEEKADPLLNSASKLVELARGGRGSPSSAKPLLPLQRELESDLLDVVDRMTQFGDINQLLQQLREILDLQQKVQQYTKELMEQP